jgi:hypothetical protein
LKTIDSAQKYFLLAHEKKLLSKKKTQNLFSKIKQQKQSNSEYKNKQQCHRIRDLHGAIQDPVPEVVSMTAVVEIYNANRTATSALTTTKTTVVSTWQT